MFGIVELVKKIKRLEGAQSDTQTISLHTTNSITNDVIELPRSEHLHSSITGEYVKFKLEHQPVAREHKSINQISIWTGPEDD